VREADHSLPSSADVKECLELYLHSPNTPSWRVLSLDKVQGQLYLALNAFFKSSYYKMLLLAKLHFCQVRIKYLN
jgi:hypothetical protein